LVLAVHLRQLGCKSGIKKLAEVSNGQIQKWALQYTDTDTVYIRIYGYNTDIRGIWNFNIRLPARLYMILIMRKESTHLDVKPQHHRTVVQSSTSLQSEEALRATLS